MKVAAANLVLDVSVTGSAVVATGNSAVNSTTGNHARRMVKELLFEPDVHMIGMPIYHTHPIVQIPTEVILVDRIHFHTMRMHDFVQGWRDRMPDMWQGLDRILLAFALVIAGLTAVAGILFAAAPDVVSSIERQATTAPFRSVGLGIAGMAEMIGLMPLLSVTLIGLPLVPLVVLAILTFWLAGYLFGILAVSTHIFGSFLQAPTGTAGRLATFLAGLIVVALLNFIPILGWLVNLAIVLLGVGAILSTCWDINIRRRLTRTSAEKPDARQDPLSSSI